MTSDGSPVTWSVNVPQGTVCTTDDTGTCSFSLTNISGTLSTSYSPYPDDPSYPGGFTGKVSDSVTGPGQTAVITINWEGSLITLTGNMSTETGPLGGATVSFDGVSDITDANGNYTLHPFADSTGTIGVAGLIRASAPLTVGSSDQTDDISIPTEGVASSVQVVDGSGMPLAGLAVTGSTSMEPSPVQGVTSDGSPVTWSVNVPPGTVCATDDTGTCSFSTLTNISGTLSTSYSPYPDDPSYPGGFTGKVSDSVTGPGQTAVITINWEGSLITLTGNVFTETGPLGGQPSHSTVCRTSPMRTATTHFTPLRIRRDDRGGRIDQGFCPTDSGVLGPDRRHLHPDRGGHLVGPALWRQWYALRRHGSHRFDEYGAITRSGSDL